MKELSSKQISEQCHDIHEFKYNYDEFRKDTKLRDVMNKMFSAEIKHAFVSTNTSITVEKDNVDWSGNHIILVNNKGKVVHMMNSEWAHIDLL